MGRTSVELPAQNSLLLKELSQPPGVWEKIFANHLLIRDLFPEYIKNSSNSKKNQKWEKDLNKYFSVGDTQMAGKRTKRWSVSLIVREMQVKLQ